MSEKKIEGISDLRDESDRDGMRIVIELKRDENAEVVLNKLYKLTPLQSTFGIIMLAIVDGRPQVLHRSRSCCSTSSTTAEVVIRRTEFELRKAEERAHILEASRSRSTTSTRSSRSSAARRTRRRPRTA